MSESQQSGFGLRVKKFLSSASAGSALGRRLISQAIGDEGNLLIHSIKAAAARDVGIDKARELKQQLLKIALKVKVLQDERLLLKKDMCNLQEPLNALALRLHDGLKPTVNSPIVLHADDDGHDYEFMNVGNSTRGSASNSSLSSSSASPISTWSRHQLSPLSRAPSAAAASAPAPITPMSSMDSLLADIERVRELCVQLLQKLISEKNITVMNQLFQYFGSRAFLVKLFQDPLYREEKIVCFTSIRRLIQPLLSMRKHNSKMQSICCYQPGQFEPYIFALRKQQLQHQQQQQQQQQKQQKSPKSPELEMNSRVEFSLLNHDEEQCDELIAEAADQFIGSTLCAYHHRILVQLFERHMSLDQQVFLMLTAPTLRDYHPFHQSLKQTVDRSIRKAWLICHTFSQVSYLAFRDISLSIFMRMVLGVKSGLTYWSYLITFGLCSPHCRRGESCFALCMTRT